MVDSKVNDDASERKNENNTISADKKAIVVDQENDVTSVDSEIIGEDNGVPGQNNSVPDQNNGVPGQNNSVSDQNNGVPEQNNSTRDESSDEFDKKNSAHDEEGITPIASDKSIIAASLSDNKEHTIKSAEKPLGDALDKPSDNSPEEIQANDGTEPKDEKLKQASKYKKSRLTFWLIPCLVILGMIACFVLGVRYWATNYAANIDEKIAEQNVQTMGGLEKNIQELSNTVNKTTADMRQLESKIRSQVESENAEIIQRLRAAESRLQAQNKRLLSLSTTTREDWLLAEAEYLLKLASQRALIEKNSQSAASLMEEADGILRDLGDPDLYALREVIQRDLTALRLVTNVDQEGIYLGLLALANEIDTIPVLPEYSSNELLNSNPEKTTSVINQDNDQGPNQGLANENKEALTEEDSFSSWKLKISSSFDRVVEKIKSSFNIVKYDESSMAMVSPEASVYVRQNLRLIIERAQLALLREQQVIYVSSLEQAEGWLYEYFPNSEMRTLFIKQLKEVADKNIVRQLPKVSESLNLLNTYIQDLHQLKGVSKPVIKAPAKQSLNNSATGGAN